MPVDMQAMQRLFNEIYADQIRVMTDNIIFDSGIYNSFRGINSAVATKGVIEFSSFGLDNSPDSFCIRFDEEWV